jgi:hypothetical protein
VKNNGEEYLSAVEKIDLMMGIIIDDIMEEPETLHDEHVAGFVQAVVAMTAQVEEASVSFTEALHTAKDMKSWSSLLRAPSKSIEHSINTILRGNEIVVSWAGRLRNLPGWVEPDPMPEEDPGATEDE